MGKNLIIEKVIRLLLELYFADFEQVFAD